MSNNESSSNDRQNVSFKFSKVASKTLTGNRLDENVSKSKDFVTSVEETEIKSILPKEKTKELIIPLIKKNNWRVKDTSNNSLTEEEIKIKKLAIQELLKETSEKNAQWENREFTNYDISIPLIVQNKIPEGFETDERMDVSLRAEESKLEDYEKVPVEKYGLAMLRGMGWKEGNGIGANNEKSVEPVQVQLRPKGLGLGADTSALKKVHAKAKEEKLDLVKGSFVNILQGSHKGFYGQVLGLDEENGRAIVKLSGGEDKVVTLPEFYITPVSKKEFDKESKIINRASYENYKREKERKEKHDLSWKEDDRRERSRDSPRDENKRYMGDSDDKSSRKSSSKHSSKRRHSKDRREDQLSSYEAKKARVWVKPQLRVRFIDEKYKKGRYFNKKFVVVDVLSSKCCTCKTEDEKYLDDISPSMLETVIPRDELAYVMIVQGKHTGELCTILKRDKSKCLATVQFLSDRSQAIKIEYDSICEYVGDITQFD